MQIADKEQAAADPVFPEFTEKAYEILRAAVNIARNQNVGKLAVLRDRLNEMFPGEAENIKAALAFWAQSQHNPGQRGAGL